MAVNPLHALMNPKSIAVVGASNNLNRMGSILTLNLLHGGFAGEVMPVHPKEATVLGREAWLRIADLPRTPDLALLVVPTALVPQMLEDFGRLGTRSVVVITAGFKEAGDEDGQAREARIREIARTWDMRFVGPNCMGIINSQLPMNMTVLPLMDFNGRLGFASQSGTYVTQTLPYLHKHGIVFSKAISVGNEANIDLVDCLEYLGQDAATRAIGLYIEGIRRADAFLEVAREVSRIKPIVAQYVGGSEAGARAGSSHTGALAGPDYVYDGLFAQAGIIRVDSIEEVYKFGWALACQPPLKGRRVAIITNSGGPATAIANTCNQNGLEVPELSPAVQAELGQLLPGHASTRNPVDLTYHTDMALITDKIPHILLGADDIDGLMIHGIMDTGFFRAIYPNFKDHIGMSEDDFIQASQGDMHDLEKLPWQYDKPLVISSFFGDEDHCTRVFQDAGVPSLDSPEKTARAMTTLYRAWQIRNRPNGSPPARPAVPPAAQDILESKAPLDEYQAKRLLAAYDIPVTREAIVTNLEQALRQAQHIGYPLALKVCAADIQHKTERSLVALDIGDDASLEQAFNDLRRRENHAPLLLAEMLPHGREFMAGMSYYPGFPPCILFGLGGIFTEALKDFALRLAPLNHADAGEMLDCLASSDLLGDFRGQPPVDRQALADLLVALGQLALDFPQIKEIDLNPIMIVDGKPRVADALVIQR